MSYKTVKFIGKEYTIPTDLLKYIELLELTSEVRMAINKKFLNLLRYSEVGCIDTDELAPEIEYQVSRYIKKLLNDGIYDRTVNDYLRTNKGYTLISEVNAAAFAKVKDLLIQKLDDYAVGLDEALTKRDSSITGLGFSIWSSSFINHAIYAAMEASELHKQESAANAEYQRDINALSNNVSAKYDGEQKRYIENVYIPNMDKAIAIFAFELLDTFISDLIKNGKINNEILNFINIDRSNDLLKNLVLSKNKVEVLQKAFEACPYNLEVFIRAYNIDLLDYDTFQTVKYFKHDYTILRKLEDEICNLKYPSTFIINYKKAEQYAAYTDSDITTVLFERTKYFAYEVVEAYRKTFKLLNNKAKAEKMMREFPESAILTGDNISKGKAQKCVNEIVSENTWRELTNKCGHSNLLDRIKAQIPGSESASTKHDVDAFLKEQLYQLFEGIRQEMENSIKDRIAEEQRKKEEQERLRIEHEKRKAEDERIRIENERIRHEKLVKQINKLTAFAKRVGIVILITLSLLILFFIGKHIYLSISNKPISEDFSQITTYELHNLNYSIPNNWEFDSEQSNHNTSCYARYDNHGNLMCTVTITYEGERSEQSFDSFISDYASSKDAQAHTSTLGYQKFSVINFSKAIVNNPDTITYLCKSYITEIEESLFHVHFMATEKSFDEASFEKIVRSVAFDEYVNPRQKTYDKAIALIQAEKYEDAIVTLTELGIYKDSANQMNVAKYGYATNLFNNKQYEEAITVYKEISDFNDSAEKLAEAMYLLAQDYIDSESTLDKLIAKSILSEIESYADSEQIIKELEVSLVGSKISFSRTIYEDKTHYYKQWFSISNGNTIELVTTKYDSKSKVDGGQMYQGRVLKDQPILANKMGVYLIQKNNEDFCKITLSDTTATITVTDTQDSYFLNGEYTLTSNN